MRTLDKILLFIACGLNVIVTSDPLAVMPPWVQYVAAVLVAGFAGIGIYTANPVGTSTRRGVN